MRLVMTICLVLILPICLLAGGDVSPRFTRDVDGVITDSSTNLQWREGPDQAMNWNQAQAWISGLGDGWGTPTQVQLKGIYLENATRMGGRDSTGVGPYPLKLDPVFQLDKAYWVWAESKDSSSAWIFAFNEGEELWNYRDKSTWLHRAFAVRSREDGKAGKGGG
ncbi:MAG: hypothetical protein WA705_06960 [Candidatus Ozemobacteraceae bacterium]